MNEHRHRAIRLEVNGQTREAEVDVRTQLVDVIRHQLGLTGTHVGCEQGSCGACTVLVDGLPMRSCLMLAPQADGTSIETIESVGADHPVASALHRHHALQCGFCTAGIVMSLVAAHRAEAGAGEVRAEVLGGHLCRCTGYVNIRRAIDAVFARGAD